jgi:cobalt-zinc-cadmium efflux system outer membrane protein
LALAVQLATGTAMAETIGEAEVIRLTSARDPQLVAARARISLAQTEEIRADRYPDPSLSWNRENAGGGAPTQDSLVVTVPVDLMGRRPVDKALARSGTANARAQVARAQNESVTQALALFYAAIAASREVEILAGAVTRFEAVARVVGHRHQQGAASGFERARIEVEAELVQSQLRHAEATAESTRATLAALLGLDEVTVALRGDLTVAPRVSPRAGRERPSIHFTRTSAQAARDAGAASSRAWFPTISLSAGLLLTDGAETDVGYLAGLSLGLPVFSRGQDLAAEAAARGAMAAAEVRVAERATQIAERMAHAQLVSASAELVRFTGSTRERVELLERAALSGYREGDLSVLELVDAQRARTEVDRRRLELELLAKQAELALRSSRGEFE